jgi:hypothetical protein
MNIYVQDSTDGKEWRSVPEACVIKSKTKAKEWFRLLIEANSIDWQVGFLLRCRSGRYFRAVDKNGTVVKY